MNATITNLKQFANSTVKESRLANPFNFRSSNVTEVR